MKPEYKIITAEDPDELESRIRALIGKGWIPSGSLVVKGCKIMQPITLHIER